jgi:hypothetical protein
VELDLERLFATLHRHKVVYVLIGGLAAVFHGSPFSTEDADITPDTDGANLIRLAAALRELNARIRTEAVPEGLPFACDAQALAIEDADNHDRVAAEHTAKAITTRRLKPYGGVDERAMTTITLNRIPDRTRRGRS